jgi:hypothetical protein
VVAGIVYWIPGSDLRFNSEMAMLLTLLMLSNMLGAVTILPLLVRLFQPRFVMREASAEPEAELRDAAASERRAREVELAR